jgi:hypothetical protein
VKTVDLRFDPDKHQYWIGKKRIPGVSEIMQKVGLTKNYDGVDPFYRDRGIATHKAIELHLKGILDPKTLDPAVQPCFEAFLAYWGNRSEPILALEKPMADENEEFAGTPDLVTSEAVYDWKCSKSHDRAAELQGQAYKLLVPDLVIPHIVVELHSDGSFEPFNYGSNSDEWQSVMMLYYWKTK